MIAWIVPFFAEKRQGRGRKTSAPPALFQRICHPVQGGGVVLIQQVGVDLARGGGGGVAQSLADVEQGRALGGGLSLIHIFNGRFTCNLRRTGL